MKYVEEKNDYIIKWYEKKKDLNQMIIIHLNILIEELSLTVHWIFSKGDFEIEVWIFEKKFLLTLGSYRSLGVIRLVMSI